ncbi:glycosyltransferase [Rhodobacteraceae bacterium F11138]|nr:glycosyltransferase [Rhodobacteraceae bacterium F11138]
MGKGFPCPCQAPGRAFAESFKYKMIPKYYFALPDLDKPVGGHNIQYKIIETLLNAGYDVASLHGARHYRYPYSKTDAPGYFFPDIAKLHLPATFQPLRKLRSENLWKHQRPRLRNPHPALERSPRDVFVLPEFIYGEYARLFLDAPLILAAQDVFGLTRAYTRDMKTEAPVCHKRFTGIYTTSHASTEAVRTLLGREPHLIGLPIDGDALSPLQKKLQIAYMPRKMKEESDLVLTVLRARSHIANIPIIPIVGMSDEERDRTLRESLFFLSFSEREGFGLPPAEAMAAECIVIGYTGVGGNEYFTPETGFPVQSNDVMKFVQTVEKVIQEYQDTPKRLDNLRRSASAQIRRKYRPEIWQKAVLEAWSDFDREIRCKLALK